MAQPPQLPRPTNAAGSFETFKRQAEERKHMESLLKQQELRRQEKESEQEKMRMGKERQRLGIVSELQMNFNIRFPTKPTLKSSPAL